MHAVASISRVALNPAQVLIHTCVHVGQAGPSTASAPGDNADQLMLTQLLVEEHMERTAAVAAAGIIHVSGAEHVVGDHGWAVAGAAALGLANNERIDFLLCGGRTRAVYWVDKIKIK